MLKEECKMQNDTEQGSTSGHIKQVISQAVAQESPGKAFHCSHCVLIFKSKVYLFEHLNIVHGLDTETSLREAGLCSVTNNANTENSSGSSGDSFKCQHCDFKANSWVSLSEHEELCQKTLENLSASTNLIISENLDTPLSVITTSQNSDAAGASESPSDLSDISTSETKCTSKDLKTYKRPLQTITKYFSVSPGSNTKAAAKLADGTRGTLILQESPSGSCSSGGVFKVTAKSVIDMTASRSYRFLHSDFTNDLTPSKPQEQFKETVPAGAVKRSSINSSKSHPAKKAKLDGEETLVEKENESRQQSSSSNEFSFEVSEDEEDAEAPKVYSCKHCDYSDVGIRRISAHYQNEHPYIRYNSVYIQDSSDQSATFRCLECPVEFLSTADLKRHYMENHPEAPDVITMKSYGLSLVFRCFLCTFTTNVLKSLKEHYKAKHATYEVENSLLFCRYSMTECQEESSLLSPERSGEIPPERTHTPQNPADMAPYKCKKCTFGHKSVVVMHVHYQKCHPDEAITIDKIKQSACVTSHAAPEMTPEKYQDSMTAVDPSETTPEASMDHSESSQTKKGESVESPTRCNNEVSTRLDNLSSSSPNEMFYCQFCSYKSTKVKSILGHHNAKHSMDAPIDTGDVLWYSVEMQKKKLQSEAKMSKSASCSQLKTSRQVRMCRETEVQHEEDHVADASETGFKSYTCPENLFYCQKCNFGNPTVKGVINHQAKIHRKCNSGSKCVLEHTALVRDEIRKAKSNATDSASHLPLPIMNEGDENAFFCHFCNYRHSTLDQVMRHYCKAHHGFKVNPSDVLVHTSKILNQTHKSPLKSMRNQEVAQEPLKKMNKKKKKLKKLAKSLLISAPTPVTAPQTQRFLKCYRCSYSTEQVYALKTHIRKTHQVKRTVTDVLRLCFRQGALEPGYHCEFCAFKHEKAASVYEHYQEHHPGRVPGLEYVTTRLYVGPGVILSEKKKHKQKRSGGEGTSKRLLFQRSGQNETGLSCRKCSLKSSSLSDLAHHYRAVHPFGAKQDRVGINTKKASTRWRVEDHSELRGSFNSRQVPVEFDKSQDEAEASSRLYKCTHCSMNFNTQHGLHVHCGIKHPETFTGKLEQQKPQKQLPKRVHIFKCPYCTYVNTVYQGILTHCQMKHPDVPSRADSLHVDMMYVQNLDDARKSSGPGESLKFNGHMCKTCPEICSTLDKLSKHCEQDHNRLEIGASAAQSTVKSALRPLAKSKILLSKVHSIHGSISKASLLSKKIYASINCQLCSYTCTTKFALGRHLLATHKHAISKDCVYKCVLCSKVYFRKKHLGGHYAVTHGKEAYLKYYVPVYKQKPSEGSLTRQQENASCKSSVTAEDSFLVYRCPKCPYVNASYHGTLTHCQMKHPAIVVRADELETGEVLAANMVGCSIGKGSNQRGYMCKKCSQIHGSLTKLNSHCKRDHNGTEVSEHLAANENQPVRASQCSAQEDEVEEGSIAETGQAPQMKTPETCRSIPLGVRGNRQLYKCQMCTYKGLYRKYLQCHYKNTHKLDAVSAHKLLEKYNKRKWKFPSSQTKLSSLPKSEDKTIVKCLKCPNVTFDSSQLLIDHYSTFHRSEWKLDFTVLSLGSVKKKTTGMYKCDHCKTQLNGIRKMCYHMDRHRARMMEMAKAAQRKASPVITATPEQESSEPCRQDEMPALETAEEVNRWNGTPARSAVVPTSPPQSPSKVSDVQQPELESNGDKHKCNLCGRMFMSLKGLRSHEHSHAALAAIKKLDLPTSALKHNISKYLIHKSGTVRPFLCSCCTYRTTVFGLWRSHFMKKHRDIIMEAVEAEDKDEESDERTDKESNSSEKMNSLPEFDEEPELVERSLYLEPPDVQRQLNHYTMMAQSSAKSKANVQESKLPENSVLHCEMCNFSTGHLSSIRRHYLNRHGKKILRCKDCSFVTGLRKTLEMHMETGHATCQSEPTHQKDLRCPFCLYQTKNKNNMIDHIVLHREERVVPIEVRRPKLSRYLQGIVFRCHKCTFTSGSPENLRFHMTRHDDIKPYKCRLCYFDCTRLSDLEAHLSDKHQVVRNHELVGQVSLDQLEARDGGMSKAEEEHLSNMEQLVREDVEMLEFFTDSDEVPQAENLEENNTTEETALQIKEAHGMQDQERNEESPGESSEFDIQQEDAKPNATVQQALQKRETAREDETRNVEQSVAEVKITDIPLEDSSGPDEERQTNENQAQPKLTDCQDKQQKDTGKDLKVAENTPAQKRDVKALERKTLNIETRVEDDVLHRILQLDDDGGEMHNEADQDRTVKTEKMEEGVEASHPSDLPLAKESSFTLSQNQKSHVNTQANSALTKIHSAHVNNTRTKETFRIERHMLTLPPNYARLKMISGDVLGVSFAKFKREQVHAQESSEKEAELCREMPVLEKECLKKEVHPPGCFKEEEEKDPLEQEQNKESEMVTEGENQLKDERCEDQDGMKEGDCLQEHKDTMTPGAAEVLCASLTEQERFICEFCGRNLVNSSELKRHVMRHGI